MPLFRKLKEVIPDLDTEEIPEINSTLRDSEPSEKPLFNIDPELGSQRREALIGALKQMGTGLKEVASDPKELGKAAYKMGFYPFSQLGKTDYSPEEGALSVIDPSTSTTAAIPVAFRKLIEKAKTSPSALKEAEKMAADHLKLFRDNSYLTEEIPRKLKADLQKFRESGPSNQLDNFIRAPDKIPLYDKGFSLVKADASPDKLSYSLSSPDQFVPSWINLSRDAAGAPSINYLSHLPEELRKQALAAQSYTQIAKNLGRLRSDATGNTSGAIKNAFWEKFADPFQDILADYDNQRFQTLFKSSPRLQEEMALYADAAKRLKEVPLYTDASDMYSMINQAADQKAKTHGLPRSSSGRSSTINPQKIEGSDSQNIAAYLQGKGRGLNPSTNTSGKFTQQMADNFNRELLGFNPEVLSKAPEAYGTQIKNLVETVEHVPHIIQGLSEDALSALQSKLQRMDPEDAARITARIRSNNIPGEYIQKFLPVGIPEARKYIDDFYTNYKGLNLIELQEKWVKRSQQINDDLLHLKHTGHGGDNFSAKQAEDLLTRAEIHGATPDMIEAYEHYLNRKITKP